MCSRRIANLPDFAAIVNLEVTVAFLYDSLKLLSLYAQLFCPTYVLEFAQLGTLTKPHRTS